MSRDPGDDGWTSEYDSTWEDEEEDGRKEDRNREQRPPYCRRWRCRAARDMQCYRHGYNEEQTSDQSCMGENAKSTPNLDFYQNKNRFEPNGVCIEDLLKDWRDEHMILERNHSYIQWLFPLREYGMNSYAKPLTQYEMKMMMKDGAVMERFLRAYKLMLRFYGIKLVSDETGEVARDNNWEERFKNLNYHSHNNLRITRILKCLGEMNYKHFQAPLVKFFLEETLCKNNLPNVKRSVLDYFMFAVKDKHKRRELVHFAWKNYKPNNHDKFIWGPEEKLKLYDCREENDVNVVSKGLRDDVDKNPNFKIYKIKKNPDSKNYSNVDKNPDSKNSRNIEKDLDSKTYKNRGQEQQFLQGQARDEVNVSQQGSKKEEATVSEMIPLEDRGVLPKNSPKHKAEARPDQSTPPLTGQEGDNSDEEKSDTKKEENVDREDAKEDFSKFHEEDIRKKSECDQEDVCEVNGLSNQNTENKRHQGDHRKRKMPDSSPRNPSAGGCSDGGGSQSSHSPKLCHEEEVVQVERVEAKVKKLKLKDKQNLYHSNGLEEDNQPDEEGPGEMDMNPTVPDIEHSQYLHTDE